MQRTDSDIGSFGKCLMALASLMVVAAFLIGSTNCSRSSQTANPSTASDTSVEKSPDSSSEAPEADSPAEPAAKDAPSSEPDAKAAATDEPAVEKAAPTAAPQPTKTGAQLYAQHCVACHGANGDGKGLAASFLFPKPRDFRAGKFRLISTQNNVPNAKDLHDVLARGMPGSSMPPWDHLTEAERMLLVQEVMRLRQEGAAEQYVQLLIESEGLPKESLDVRKSAKKQHLKTARSPRGDDWI
ncbi:MAG: c-type cytochrome [Pirellulaceae bacterium]|jgi:mono/diheme cytochrome c family protein|nr:c-type cytochrome [Pirellulaceae bacterium]